MSPFRDAKECTLKILRAERCTDVCGIYRTKTCATEDQVTALCKLQHQSGQKGRHATRSARRTSQARSTTKAANAACAGLENGVAAGGSRRCHKSCDVCVGDTWEHRFFVDLESMGAMLHDNFENGHREPRELVHDTYSGVLPADNRCGFDSFCVPKAAGEKIIDRTPKRVVLTKALPSEVARNCWHAAFD